MNAFSVAQVPDRRVPSKALQNDSYLLFGAELAAGKTLYILDELLGLFCPGLSLPEPVSNLRNGLLPHLNLLPRWPRSKPPSVGYLLSHFCLIYADDLQYSHKNVDILHSQSGRGT